MNKKISNGILIAFNCTPEDVDNKVHLFWEKLNEDLKKINIELLLISTTEIKNEKLNHIYIPYNLKNTHKYLKEDIEFNINSNTIETIRKINDITKNEAQTIYNTLYSFFNDMLYALKPIGVIGWQSDSPMTSIIKEVCSSHEILFWVSERGFLRNTLLFDTVGYGLISETSTSIVFNRLENSIPFDEQSFQAIKNKYLLDLNQSRYKTENYISQKELEKKYNIISNRKSIAWFAHLEPVFFPRPLNNALVDYYEISYHETQKKLNEITDFCIKNNINLIVQEHPLNIFTNYKLRYKKHENIIHTKENVKTLLTYCDYYLFTTGTIQFDALFYDKPIGFLSKGPLNNTTDSKLYINNYKDTYSFMKNLIYNRKIWENEKESLFKKINILKEYYLLDIENEDNLEKSTNEIVKIISKFQRTITERDIIKIDDFLKKWGRK